MVYLARILKTLKYDLNMEKSGISSHFSQKIQTPQERKPFLGRYRVIIIAIACFLVVDIGVLMVNFYTSFQLKDDAIGINLSGRQRMLSQRVTKELLIVGTIPITIAPNARNDLKDAAALFDSTLHGFNVGAQVTGGDGRPVFLKAVTTPDAKDALEKANAIWREYHALLIPVINGVATPEQQNEALTFGLKNNATLLQYMNDLTNDLEHTANNRANFLRMVQSTGIVLALLNFLFILFKFIRQLKTADMAIEEANRENTEILKTVREGLFLLTPQNTIGTQISKSASRLFGQQLNPGDDFIALLSSRVSSKVLQDGEEYIKLLLSPHINEELVKGINPLSDIEVLFENKLGVQEKHYLSFDFSRVTGTGDAIKHLLVTVQDITQRVQLQEQLKVERKSSQREFSTFIKAMDADPNEFMAFITNAEKVLLEINEKLRTLSEIKNTSTMWTVVDGIARDMHAFKGNAAILNLDVLADQAHDFETALSAIKSSNLSSAEFGEAILPLPISLGNLLKTVTLLKGLAHIGTYIEQTPTKPLVEVVENSNDVINESKNSDEKIANVFTDTSSGVDIFPPGAKPRLDPTVINPLDFNLLNQLTKNIAHDLGKQVELTIINDAPWASFSAEKNQLLREISVQLLRNAIVHGIELPEKRVSMGKPSLGQVSITMGAGGAENSWTLCIRDDGSGLSPARIRARLRQKGLLSQEQLIKMTDEDVIRQIFTADFSTSGAPTLHAGRGVGLSLVRSLVKRLPSDRLKVRTGPNLYTEFSVNFQSV